MTNVKLSKIIIVKIRQKDIIKFFIVSLIPIKNNDNLKQYSKGI